MLIHGAGGGAWEWNRWHNVLQAHAVAVQAVELQPTAHDLAATTLQDYAIQVQLALQALPRPRVLVGASLGGLLAAMCVSEADAVVLVNPLPPVPWHRQMAQRSWDRVVRWRSNARLYSTREAMRDADDASALWAFRHWRDESGQALSQAHAGVDVAKPDCPALFVVSSDDEDVPREIILDWARAWRADRLETLASSHLGPLLGRQAQAIAVQAVAWLNRLGREG